MTKQQIILEIENCRNEISILNIADEAQIKKHEKRISALEMYLETMEQTGAAEIETEADQQKTPEQIRHEKINEKILAVKQKIAAETNPKKIAELQNEFQKLVDEKLSPQPLQEKKQIKKAAPKTKKVKK